MRRAKDAGGNISTSNTTESTNSGGAAALTTVLDPKDNRNVHHITSGHHSHSKSSSNPIYKQRAYLSKGVPVILYEEMSDKPLEDYDENNADSTGGSSRLIGSYYRSPYIMRFEKPPMPAPPEYSRDSLFDAKKTHHHLPPSTVSNPIGDESVLNELRSMLSRDLDTVGAANSGDYFGDEAAVSVNKSSPSSSTSPAVIDSDDNVHLLGNHHRCGSKPPSGLNTRQNLVNEIFMANARLKHQLNQLNQITDITDLNNKHQLQKLLP